MVEASATRSISSRNIITNPLLNPNPSLLSFSNKFLRLKPPSKISFSSIRNEESSLKWVISRSRNQTVATFCFLGLSNTLAEAAKAETAEAVGNSMLLGDLNLGLEPGTAKVAIGFIGPFLSAFSFLFILRIVMSWYPKIPLGKFPYVIAYAPTEPFLVQTRKLIPPLAGVDITPVVWVGLLNFLNEILVGPQGLLVLVSQQLNT